MMISQQACPPTRTFFEHNWRLMYDNHHVSDVHWNFEKFLIAPQTGQVVRRYDELTSAIDIVKHLQILRRKDL